MDNPLIAATDPSQVSPALDYPGLRQEGIELIARLAGKRWTDFNSHDPGITILEALCYALTDLGYRINYDMRDLLAPHEGNPYLSLFSPGKVLTCNPVTAADFRKLMIDLDGVRNAWIEEVQPPEPALFHDPSDQTLYLESAIQRETIPIRGVCRVLIETDQTRTASEVLQDVSKRLHACRNLCQDFLQPIILPLQLIMVHAVVEIGDGEEPAKLFAGICRVLADFISPRVRFYSLAEMRDRGKSIDEILNGPVLQNGFIDTGELEGTKRATAIRVSDLIQLIMDLPGVVAVHSITVSLVDAAGTEGKAEPWYLELDVGSSPCLSASPDIRLVRGQITRSQQTGIQMLTDRQTGSSRKPLPESERDVILDPGRDRQIERYYSVQHHLPAVYGIGAQGLPATASDLRKSQARQLKAYLMFFDQILANYFSQVAHAKDLFSFEDTKNENGEPDRTYFSQIVDDPDLNLRETRVHDDPTFRRNLQNLTENPACSPEDPGTRPDYSRINRFLNHLLARFSEQFADYSLLAKDSSDQLVRAKRLFLRGYDKSGAERGCAFDYTLPSWVTDNVSGLEKRITRKLGLLTWKRRSLAGLPSSDQGGFHMIEQILLRPREADQRQGFYSTLNRWQAYALLAKPRQKDPYSAQLTFIFPDWIDRFNLPDFKHLIEQTLREETPAHLNVSIQWLKQAEMEAFETAFKDWLESLRN
jgi:hypothetical protein